MFIANKQIQENEMKEDKHFQEMYEQWKGVKTKDNDVTYKIIPKFYFKVYYLYFCPVESVIYL